MIYQEDWGELWRNATDEERIKIALTYKNDWETLMKNEGLTKKLYSKEFRQYKPMFEHVIHEGNRTVGDIAFICNKGYVDQIWSCINKLIFYIQITLTMFKFYDIIEPELIRTRTSEK